MLSWLKTQAEERHKARKLYGAVVARARDPLHFTLHGVADTPEGRYEMIVLHLALLADRLLAEGEPGRRLAKRVNEVFVTDMDDAMREMGVGDLTVPRKVKKAAAGLYDRFEAYRAAIQQGRPQLEGILAGVLEQSGGDVRAASALAGYAAALARMLSSNSGAELLAGDATFLHPHPIASAGESS